jgi:UDP-N-acetylglucosamine acyltransferase
LFAEEGTLAERIEDVAVDFAGHKVVMEILQFLRGGGSRSICTPRDSHEA